MTQIRNEYRHVKDWDIDIIANYLKPSSIVLLTYYFYALSLKALYRKDVQV